MQNSDIDLIPVEVVTAENSLKNNYSTSFELVLVICWLKYISNIKYKQRQCYLIQKCHASTIVHVMFDTECKLMFYDSTL